MADSAAILGEYNVYGDSGAISDLAEHLHSRAHIVHQIQGELLGNGPHIWSGEAAEAFKGALGELPKELDKLFDSYGKAGRVLEAYAHELHAHKLKAHQLADKIAHARQLIKAAGDAKVQAQVDYDSAKGIRDSPISYPESVVVATKDMATATTALGHANAKISDNNSVISAAMSAAKANRADFVAKANACCDHLNDAADLGIKNIHRKGLDAVLHNLGSFAKGFVDAITDALAELSDLLDLPVLLAGLLVIAAGIATVLSDGVAAPLLGYSLTILEGLTAAKVTADLGAVAAGKKDPSVLLEDALSVLGRGAGKKVLPPGTYDKLVAALDRGAANGNAGQKAYAAELKRIFLGNVLKRSSQVAAELSPKLREELEKILSEAGCSVHHGSVPAH